MCSESGLLTTGKKHELVRCMAENNACYEDPVTKQTTDIKRRGGLMVSGPDSGLSGSDLIEPWAGNFTMVSLSTRV